MIDWLIDWLIDLLIYWFIDLLIYWFIDLLIYWFIDLLIDWSIDWLIDCLIILLIQCSLIYRFTVLFVYLLSNGQCKALFILPHMLPVCAMAQFLLYWGSLFRYIAMVQWNLVDVWPWFKHLDPLQIYDRALQCVCSHASSVVGAILRRGLHVLPQRLINCQWSEFK